VRSRLTPAAESKSLWFVRDPAAIAAAKCIGPLAPANFGTAGVKAVSVEPIAAHWKEFVTESRKVTRGLLKNVEPAVSAGESAERSPNSEAASIPNLGRPRHAA